MKRNPHRVMVAEILGSDPVEFSRTKRAEGFTLQQIARELYQATNGKVDVAYSTVRNWLLEEPTNGSAA